jgi:flagellar motor protein MotB
VPNRETNFCLRVLESNNFVSRKGELSTGTSKKVASALFRGNDARLAAQIQYFAFGETDLRVNTEDGIKEPANRRVEIFLE